MTPNYASVIRRVMRTVSLFSLIFLSGCLTNDSLETSSIAEGNVHRLTQLSQGMTEEVVFSRMGPPSREEQFSIKQEQYDIWFYLTRATVLDQGQLVFRNLTPVIFREAVLIGMGYVLYDRLVYEASLSNQEGAESENIPADKEKTPYLNEEDDRMLQEEEEEDFNNR